MKKVAILSLVVATLFACTKEQAIETPERAVISFENAFINNSTRAAEDITNSNLVDFGVYGTIAANGASGVIFDNTKVSGNSTSGYTYSPAQYWIPSAQYHFEAIAPYTNAKWSYAHDGKTVQNGILTFNNQAAAASQDLLYAYNIPAKTADAITTKPAPVDFTFSHLLSKIVFKFTNGFAEGSNMSLKVYNVAINNAASEGTLPVAECLTGSWSAAADNNSFAINFGPKTADEVAAIADNNTSATTEHFYLIPVSREYNITFSVDIYQAGVKVGETYNHTINTVISLEKGKSYSLNATLNAENVVPGSQVYPIEFSVNPISGWVNASQTIK